MISQMNNAHVILSPKGEEGRLQAPNNPGGGY